MPVFTRHSHRRSGAHNINVLIINFHASSIINFAVNARTTRNSSRGEGEVIRSATPQYPVSILDCTLCCGSEVTMPDLLAAFPFYTLSSLIDTLFSILPTFACTDTSDHGDRFACSISPADHDGLRANNSIRRKTHRIRKGCFKISKIGR